MRVRDARVDDYEAFVRLVPELKVPDPVPSREKYEQGMCARMVMAEEGEVVGYLLYEILAEVGYVRHIVSDPGRRRMGIGAALMAEARRRFEAAGVREWCLNVKPENVAAIGLYERCGLRPAYRSHVMRLPREAPAADVVPGVTVREIAPEDERAVEDATRLLRGQLASARGKLGRQLLQLRRGEAITGVAVFDASFPGAFPFRVTEPALGPGFLEVLRARAPADAPHVQVGIEDDEPLRDALLARGAYVFLEIQHMRGRLDHIG